MRPHAARRNAGWQSPWERLPSKAEGVTAQIEPVDGGIAAVGVDEAYGNNLGAVHLKDDTAYYLRLGNATGRPSTAWRGSTVAWWPRRRWRSASSAVTATRPRKTRGLHSESLTAEGRMTTRNKRRVSWPVDEVQILVLRAHWTRPFSGAHFAAAKDARRQPPPGVLVARDGPRSNHVGRKRGELHFISSTKETPLAYPCITMREGERRAAGAGRTKTRVNVVEEKAGEEELLGGFLCLADTAGRRHPAQK
jgi:hypothetical protein